MVTKKRIVKDRITIGTRLIVRVGGVFKREVIQVTVNEVSPNGNYVKFGDGIEWFAIDSLTILDIIKG